MNNQEWTARIGRAVIIGAIIGLLLWVYIGLHISAMVNHQWRLLLGLLAIDMLHLIVLDIWLHQQR